MVSVKYFAIFFYVVHKLHLKDFNSDYVISHLESFSFKYLLPLVIKEIENFYKLTEKLKLSMSLKSFFRPYTNISCVFD